MTDDETPKVKFSMRNDDSLERARQIVRSLPIGTSKAEIARRLGCSVSTVYKRAKDLGIGEMHCASSTMHSNEVDKPRKTVKKASEKVKYEDSVRDDANDADADEQEQGDDELNDLLERLHNQEITPDEFKRELKKLN